MKFEDALPPVLVYEGGIVNDPDDPGGLTNQGVTQAAYDAYCKKRHIPTTPVTQLTSLEIQTFYRDEYWTPIRAESLPDAVAMVLFDAAVNQGVGYAAKLLQWAVGVKQDGQIGTITLTAVQGKDPEELAQTLLWARMMRYVALCRAWESKGKARPYKYLYGWVLRLDKVRLLTKLGPAV